MEPINTKKSYIGGYKPKDKNVIKLSQYIQSAEIKSEKKKSSPTKRFK